MDDDYTEPPPPSAERVVRRALILAAISCRGIVDGDHEASALAEQSRNWIYSTELHEDLSQWESRVFDTPFGSLSNRDRINASWLSEATTVLAWSLGKSEMPAFDAQCDPRGVAESVGFLSPLTTPEPPVLRTVQALQDYNSFISVLHWRLRDFSLFKRNYDFESLAREALGEPILKYGLQILDKDLAIGGFPILHAEDDAWQIVMSITRERHRASNWLIGYASEDFYEVTTDT